MHDSTRVSTVTDDVPKSQRLDPVRQPPEAAATDQTLEGRCYSDDVHTFAESSTAQPSQRSTASVSNRATPESRGHGESNDDHDHGHDDKDDDDDGAWDTLGRDPENPVVLRILDGDDFDSCAFIGFPHVYDFFL